MTYESKGKYTVYSHINKINGKIYIGITSQNPFQRWRRGTAYKDNSYFTNAINKYGWEGFIHEIIAKNLTESEARSFEKTLISKYDTTNRNLGYNLTKGGEPSNGLVHSQEAKEKIRIGHLGKKNHMYGKHHTEKTKEINRIAHTGKNNTMYGKHLSEEAKNKISNALKNRIVSKETGYKISNALKGKYAGTNSTNFKSVICLETGKIYDYIKQATNELGLYSGGISACIRGKQKTCGKLSDGTMLHWMLYDEYIKTMD